MIFRWADAPNDNDFRWADAPNDESHPFPHCYWMYRVSSPHWYAIAEDLTRDDLVWDMPWSELMRLLGHASCLETT